MATLCPDASLEMLRPLCYCGTHCLQGDRWVVKNYRPVSLTSVACKQMEHVIAGYIQQGWEDRDWLYEGQHGFRLGYSCESQIITVCQDISDFLDEATKLDAITTNFFESF